MKKMLYIALCTAVSVVGLFGTQAFAEWHATNDTKVENVGYIESVIYDAASDTWLASRFGPELDSTLQDGLGDIALLNADGTVNTEGFLPGDDDVLNKPKGMVLSGDRLWVTDIDSVWVFDTTTKQGVKITPTGAQFLNDVTLIGDVLYVADTQANSVYAIEPADFISAPPQVTTRRCRRKPETQRSHNGPGRRAPHRNRSHRTPRRPRVQTRQPRQPDSRHRGARTDGRPCRAA